MRSQDLTLSRSPGIGTASRAIGAAYWLLLSLRDRMPRPHALASAEFATIRLHLLKLAGRVIETASRVRIAFCRLSARGALPRPRPQLPASRAVSDRA